MLRFMGAGCEYLYVHVCIHIFNMSSCMISPCTDLLNQIAKGLRPPVQSIMRYGGMLGGGGNSAALFRHPICCILISHLFFPALRPLCFRCIAINSLYFQAPRRLYITIDLNYPSSAIIHPVALPTAGWLATHPSLRYTCQ